jgi:hypothetical protein
MLEIIAQIESGSKLYDLSTPQSDVDYYSVGLNTELKHIIGIDKFEHQIIQNDEIDSTCMELRNFFNLCRKANTSSYELLSAPQSKFIKLNSKFRDLVLLQRHRFFNSERLFKCLMGYAQGEKRAMLGVNTGKLGDKRKKQIEKLGFCSSNACHLFRLLRTGIVFFKEGIYITSFKEYDEKFHNLLFDIKVNSTQFDKDNLLRDAEVLEATLKTIFDMRDVSLDLTFDEEYANYVLLQFYYPKLKEFYNGNH